MTKTLKQTGRPPKTKRPSIYSTPLYKMLLANLPSDFVQDDRINTEKLSEAMPNKRMTIYRWFQGFNMSNKSAVRLVELSAAAKCERKGLLTVQKLLPFVGL